jgi:hypothetical protein
MKRPIQLLLLSVVILAVSSVPSPVRTADPQTLQQFVAVHLKFDPKRNVVSDTAGNLVSGTYTEQKHFQFYGLNNVVMNGHDVQPPPTSRPDSAYTFTLMGVSKDNWVNLMAMEPFTTAK